VKLILLPVDGREFSKETVAMVEVLIAVAECRWCQGLSTLENRHEIVSESPEAKTVIDLMHAVSSAS
jgi:hypothetical protein